MPAKEAKVSYHILSEVFARAYVHRRPCSFTRVSDKYIFVAVSKLFIPGGDGGHTTIMSRHPHMTNARIDNDLGVKKETD